MVTEESLALLLKRLTDSGGIEIAKMLKIFVSVASCVDEQRFNPRWLQLFTRYLFHLDRGTLWDLTT
jgi:hypothetical protein